MSAKLSAVSWSLVVLLGVVSWVFHRAKEDAEDELSKATGARDTEATRAS